MIIEIQGVKLNYTVSGQGPDMVLMHGWGCQASTLASIEKVASETHKVFNIDFPGFGSSEEPPTVWGVDDYARM
ncbi:MAG: alpha/beta hydrolase, partial [Muribaculaceae bacterium]|nr:alpha/beta hydrolase [Muribaculaceae bacterium]